MEEETLSDTSHESATTNLNILQVMLEALRKLGKKWFGKNIGAYMLYKYYLSNSDSIEKSFVVPELEAMNETFYVHTNQKIFNKTDNKLVKVNKMAKVFAHRHLDVMSPGQVPCHVKSLKDLC